MPAWRPAAPAFASRPWTLVLAMGIGVFVGGFDQTFVVPVLSHILGDFGISVDEYGQASWVVNGYLLGYAIAMPIMGRIADVYGHVRVFLISLVVYMAASVLVALSAGLVSLSLARALTAVGGGALVPIALAVAAGNLRRDQRPLGLATVSVLDDTSSLLGPLWGTLIGVWLGWRGLFWMNIVLAIPVLVAVVLIARSQRVAEPRSGRVDWTGGILLTAGLATLTFAIADVSTASRPLSVTIALYAAAAALLAAFATHAWRAVEPLVDLRALRNPRLLVANTVFFLEGMALITALVNVPLMTEVLWDMGGAAPGLMLARMVLFMVVGGLAGGLLATRIGYRLTAVLGSALAGVGLMGMVLWPEQPTELARWTVLAVAGIGFTLTDAVLYATVIDETPENRRASAVAFLQVLQTIGMVVGMALLSAQGLGRFGERAGELFESGLFEVTEEQYREIMHRTFDETFFVAALLMALAAALAFFLPRGNAHERAVSDPAATLLLALRRRLTRRRQAPRG